MNLELRLPETIEDFWHYFDYLSLHYSASNAVYIQGLLAMAWAHLAFGRNVKTKDLKDSLAWAETFLREAKERV